MLVHDHQKSGFHRFLNPIGSGFTLPLMLNYILSQDKPNLKEGIQGPVGHRDIMEVPPCVPDIYLGGGGGGGNGFES